MVEAAARALADHSAVWERPFVFVTGKGGVGKTTVAAGAALASAEHGCPALICEIGEGAEGPVRSLRIDPEQALGEWLTRHLGATAAALLSRAPAFRYLVAAAPGAAELVTIGKAVDETADHQRVIVDGPATGHALALLGAPATFGELVPRGPVGSEARQLHARLADPDFAAYIGVTMPEDLAVSELLDLERGLPEVIGRGLDLVVVNAMHADRFSDEDAVRLQAAHLDAVVAEHRLARGQAAQVRRLRATVEAPVITVPFVFAAP